MKRAEILGFVSTKGGVGKTTVVSNLGHLLSDKYGKSVLVVDGNFTAPSLHTHFGLMAHGQGLADAMAGRAMMKEVVMNHSKNLDFLPVGFVAKNLDYKAMRSYLCSMRSKYDYILIDSSPAINAETLGAIYASDKIFLIATPDHVSMNNGLQTVNLAIKSQTYISGVILNKSKNKLYEVSSHDVEKVLGAPVLSAFDDSEKVLKSLADFKTVVDKYPRSSMAQGYSKLAASICGKEYKADSLLTRFKGLFSSKISQEDINRTLLMDSHY